MILHNPYGETDPQPFWERLRSHVAAHDVGYLAAAYDIARRAHAGQSRQTVVNAPRVPYIVHPLRVGLILAEEWKRTDLMTLQTALLHDVLEDVAPDIRNTYEDEIAACVSREVSDAVCTLTKAAPGPADVKDARDARYFAELRRAPAWIRYVKCADRVDNLRDALAWGNPKFWDRYRSETIGWHLYLARETAPIAEVALFKALVEGERHIHGSVPIWADGHLIDVWAAGMIPEHIALNHRIIGLALQGRTLVVGMENPRDEAALEAVKMVTHKDIVPIPLSDEAIADALSAQLYGSVGRN